MELPLPPPPAGFDADPIKDQIRRKTPENFKTPPSPATPPVFSPQAFTPPPNVRPGKVESTVTTEWVGPSVVKIGQPMPCQLMVCNNGPMAVHQVVVRHSLPEGVEHRSSEPTATVDGRALSWNLGTLEAGQVRKIHVQLVAQARGPLQCYATVTFSSCSVVPVEVREPMLSVKIKGPEKMVAGDDVTFLITLSNPGDWQAEKIEVKANLPEGLEHSRGRSLQMVVPSLAPKESRTMQLICQARGIGSKTVTVRALAEGNLKANDQTTVEIAQPKLDLIVTGPKLRYIDRHAVYTLKVNNPGNALASNVTLTEIVPAGFKFHQASGQGQFDKEKHAVTWFVGDLMPGQNREVSLDLIASAAGEHKLVGTVNSARGVKNEAEVRTRVEGLSKLEVDVTDTEDPVEVGTETMYKIRVVNSGTKMETNIQVACELPGQMEFVKANMPYHLEGRTVIFDPLPSLAPLGEVFYTVSAKGMQPGNLRVRIRVRADNLTEPMVREEVTRVYNDDSMP